MTMSGTLASCNVVGSLLPALPSPKCALISNLWNTTSMVFQVDPDMEIRYNASQDFQVKVDILDLGGDFVDKIIEAHPFENGFIASIPDLLRLRATTVIERGDEKDLKDFSPLTTASRNADFALSLMAISTSSDSLCGISCQTLAA